MDDLFTSTEVEKIISALTELGAEQLDNYKGQGDKLRLRAQQLLNLEKVYKSMKEKKFKNLTPKSAEALLMADNLYRTRIIKMCIIFQKDLDAYLGSLPRKIIYVERSESGEPILYEQKLSVLTELKASSSKLSSSSNKVQIEEFGNKEHLKKGKAAYMGVLNRLEVFRKESKQSYNLLMWKEPGGSWTLANVQSKGDVAEAYVNFIYTSHGTKKDYLYNNKIGNPKYYNHGLIKNFFCNYITQVDNLSPVVEEDVVVGGRFQIGVKSEDASTFGFENYFKVAQMVNDKMSENIEITKEMVRGAVRNPALRNAIRGSVNVFSKKSLEKLKPSKTTSKWEKLFDVLSDENSSVLLNVSKEIDI